MAAFWNTFEAMGGESPMARIRVRPNPQLGGGEQPAPWALSGSAAEGRVRFGEGGAFEV
jgi:hypothetical protein